MLEKKEETFKNKMKLTKFTNKLYSQQLAELERISSLLLKKLGILLNKIKDEIRHDAAQ